MKKNVNELKFDVANAEKCTEEIDPTAKIHAKAELLIYYCTKRMSLKPKIRI